MLCPAPAGSDCFATYTNRPRRFDARTLVVGFPLKWKAVEGSAAFGSSSSFAPKFASRWNCQSIFQDERLTSREAEEILRSRQRLSLARDIDPGRQRNPPRRILRDFHQHSRQQRMRVSRQLD